MKKVIFILGVALSLLLLLANYQLSFSQEDKIILKILVVNPSKAQSKFLPFKVYLPPEATPEDVVEKGDLKIAFDSQQGAYYVYKDFDLKPGETLVKEIQIKDIWNVSPEEMNAIRTEAENLSKLLANSDFAERANFLKNSIEERLKLIIERQRQPVATADKHISDYRENKRTLEMVRADIGALKGLMVQMNKPISSSLTWKLILGITLFLGLLGIAFFIMWSRQIKEGTQKPEKAKPESIISGEKREVEEKKKVELKDIEDRLKQ